MIYTYVAIILIISISTLLWMFIGGRTAWFSAPFVPTESKVVERMLKLADINKNDILYDLGSGDGKIIVASALRGVKSTGIEMELFKVIYSRLFIRMLKLQDTAKIIHGNFFEKDISKATIITIFLLHETNQKLKDKFKKELKPGTKIVSYGFILEDWKPEKIHPNEDSIFGPIYLYKI